MRTYGNTNLPEGMADRPLVTFAVFAYNQEKYIREAVEGAFSQTYSPLEIILSDDCSSDRTFEIMEEMARRYEGPHRVVVRCEITNKGTLGHLLSASRISRGVFFVVAAGDDISLPNRTLALVEAMLPAASDVAVASSDDVMFDDHGSEFDANHNTIKRRKYLSDQKGWFHGATACFRAAEIKRLPLPNAHVLFEDKALMAVFSETGKNSIRIEKPLIRRRVHDQNVGPIRSLENSDVWSIEQRRLSHIGSTAIAFAYAASAASLLGGDSKEIRMRANFLEVYAKWSDVSIFSRLQLLLKSPRFGYTRALAIRLLGRRFFIFIKTLSSQVGAAYDK